MSQTEKPLVNRVANSGLISINLEDYYPDVQIVNFDLKDYLFQGLILREKDFRESLKDHDWTQYEGVVLSVICSSDAIIPVWAYMLVGVNAQPFALEIYQGSKESYIQSNMLKSIREIDATIFEDQRLVIKGCSDKPVPPAAYLALTTLLRPYAKSIMYGEPCSTVPIYKQKLQTK